MTLTILLLDDNPDDRALARRELERHFRDCKIAEVGDRAAFETHMQAELAFDIVITDFQMRWTTGLEVLKRVKAYDAELPVIMFTATGTQEIAVEAMKLGLDDYVIKSPQHYARLPVAVTTCLDRTEIRARAIRSETRLSVLLETIHLGVFRMSLGGRLEEANASLRSMLGADLEDLGPFKHPLLARVRGKLSSLERTSDTAEIRAQIDDGHASAKFYVVKLVRVKVNGHDAVDGIVEDATSLHEANAEIHRLNAELEQRNIKVRAHRLTLVQALANLLSNACKFARPGVPVIVSVHAKSTERNTRITVQDNGIGIEEDALGRIFNVFERLHGEEAYSGTGIGLAIVKKGVERMGGEVGVKSTPGSGPAFWIELPLA